MYEEKKVGEELAPVPTTDFGDVQDYPKTDATHDAVFGEINEDGPNYRDVGWMGTVILMMKTQIGLGVLGIPSALHTLGMVPGVIILIVVACMTTWSGYMVGKFKLLHPHVYGIDDAGAIFGGRIGREILWFGFVICESSASSQVKSSTDSRQTSSSSLPQLCLVFRSASTPCQSMVLARLSS